MVKPPYRPLCSETWPRAHKRSRGKTRPGHKKSVNFDAKTQESRRATSARRAKPPPLRRSGPARRKSVRRSAEGRERADAGARSRSKRHTPPKRTIERAYSHHSCSALASIPETRYNPSSTGRTSGVRVADKRLGVGQRPPFGLPAASERLEQMRREELVDLNAFATVADEQSFTRPAANLRTSQSALSHTINRLEARVGVRLLARTTRNVAPTEAGERMLRALGPAGLRFGLLTRSTAANFPPAPAGLAWELPRDCIGLRNRPLDLAGRNAFLAGAHQMNDLKPPRAHPLARFAPGRP